MNILHISDLHFGPRHWDGDDKILLEMINSFDADIVINTGDNTTDGLEDECAEAGRFLKAIKCKNVISTWGNHDKRNMRSHEFFRKYIDNSEIISISETIKTRKKNIFLNREITKVNENFTDINFIKPISINGKTVLIISIDTNELYNDNGYVEKEILNAVSKEIEQIEYDLPLLITHYSILGTDECPLTNSADLIDFVQKHKIQYVFCGHTHELEIMRTNDQYHGFSFTHFMCGSLSSSNHPKDDNMFLYYENVGSDDMHLHLIRIFLEMDKVHFKQEKVF
ncbi:metallophosphoesterase family protein [Methanococcoides burtonii]|uniref:Metallophosphoesterase domain protein n=1 Tax=Methanococcoides burtonii (strain DSM 6242 / NBRC 107633 / OCM 468 / ACE-M) TaxID=259564 RepID=Q12YI9_METBU|nr:metallophosphoesterase [Methanococcoides burtonii]ABE51487.1 metallophosphoesterase domain protein [Methanococcoides burtonii DSM 6242]